MDNRENKSFRLIDRAASFKYATRGLALFIRNTHNSWIQLFFGLLSVALGVYFSITTVEWLLLIITVGFLLFAEAINTAMEVHMDLTSPDPHPFARDTKDIAAGAVLIASVVAGSVFLILFLQRVISALS